MPFPLPHMLEELQLRGMLAQEPKHLRVLTQVGQLREQIQVALVIAREEEKERVHRLSVEGAVGNRLI